MSARHLATVATVAMGAAALALLIAAFAAWLNPDQVFALASGVSFCQ